MPALYELDREALQQVYATVPEGFQVDHCIPKVHPEVSGLHLSVNTQHLVAKMNSRAVKGRKFDPDNIREQRPANRAPGGSFNPEPTPHEAELIQHVKELLGEPVEVSLETLRNALDHKAREYETYYAEVLEPAFVERWQNTSLNGSSLGLK